MLTDKEILRLYWGGLTIKRLTEMVRSTEDCTLREARARVERVIYESQRKVVTTHEGQKLDTAGI